MNVLVVSGGKAPSKELLINEVSRCDYIICADSGANCLYENNICPQMLLGDFDSIKKDVLKEFKKSDCKILDFPKEKDFTDSEMAIEEAMKIGAKNIVLLGFTGTRIDHVLGNLGLLLKCLKKGVNAVIKDDHNTILIADKPLLIKGKKDDIFSLQAYCEKVHDLTIKGAKYPLNKYQLELGDSRTISNEFSNEEVEITFSKGRILLILPKD